MEMIDDNAVCWLFSFFNPYKRGDAYIKPYGYGEWCKLIFEDEEGNLYYTDFTFITYGSNAPPSLPIINGPDRAKVEENVSFTVFFYGSREG